MKKTSKKRLSLLSQTVLVLRPVSEMEIRGPNGGFKGTACYTLDCSSANGQTNC